MRALVTGGGGFLGSYVVGQLVARGDHVTVFARGDYSGRLPPEVRHLRGDLADAAAVEQACAGVDTVFHVAAKAGYVGDRDAFFRTNVVGTDNLIAACRKHRVKKLVYTSSPSVVIGDDHIRDGDETLPYPRKYHSHYPATKAEAERQILAAHGQEGLVTTALRPHVIWGPGDAHVFPRLIERAKTGKLRIVGDGRNRVSVIYVENAAHGHLLAADSDAVGGKVYFINEKEPIVFWEWINAFFSRIGVPVVTRKVSHRTASLVSTLSEWCAALLPFYGEPLVNRFLVNLFSQDHFFSIVRAEADFGYESLVSMEEGLKRTVAYFGPNGGDDSTGGAPKRAGAVEV